jgi:hypothetical protein
VDLEARAVAESLAMAYLGQKLRVAADGRQLVGRIAEAGNEEKMWWYLVQYPMTRPAAKLSIANRIFFEMFDDQQNLLKVLQLASGEETSLYFVPGEPGPATLSLTAP